MDRSPGFGSMVFDFRPFKTRFPFGSSPSVINLAAYHNSLARSTKSTISQIALLYLLVGTGFQVLFHSPPGVLFTFPSRYYFSIGHWVVFPVTQPAWGFEETMQIKAVDPAYATLFRLQPMAGGWIGESDAEQRLVPIVINSAMWDRWPAAGSDRPI